MLLGSIVGRSDKISACMRRLPPVEPGVSPVSVYSQGRRVRTLLAHPSNQTYLSMRLISAECLCLRPLWLTVEGRQRCSVLFGYRPCSSDRGLVTGG